MKTLTLLIALTFISGCATMAGEAAADKTYASCIDSGKDTFTCEQYAEQSYYRAVNAQQNVGRALQNFGNALQNNHSNFYYESIHCNSTSAYVNCF